MRMTINKQEEKPEEGCKMKDTHNNNRGRILQKQRRNLYFFAKQEENLKFSL